MKPKILIIEDEPAIRTGLCDVFIYNGYDVEAVGDGKTGLERALSGTHHLILLDIMLPELDGLSVCDAIRKKDRSLPIVMLTAKGDEDDVVKGLRLGADDYVPKPFSVKELVARVEAVLRRSPKLALEQSLITWKDFTLDPKNLTLTRLGQTAEVTRREAEIIAYLVKHSTRPVSRQELLKEVWGYANPNIDTRTVDIHITKLRRKLGDDPESPQTLITVRGEGYKFV